MEIAQALSCWLLALPFMYCPSSSVRMLSALWADSPTVFLSTTSPVFRTVSNELKTCNQYLLDESINLAVKIPEDNGLKKKHL